jgi:hypothetical protein
MTVRDPSLPARQVFDVEIELPDVSDPARIGRELREHERGRLCRRATELPQLSAGEIQHPVVAPGVLPPHRLGVGEDQELLLVRGPGVVFDLERGGIPCRDQFGSRDKYISRASLGVVPHDVLARTLLRVLQDGVGGTAGQPPSRAEELRLEFGRTVDAANGEERRVVSLGIGWTRNESEQGDNLDCPCSKESDAAHDGTFRMR